MKQNKITALFLLMLCVLVLSACSSRNAMNNSQSWPGITADGDTVYAANGNMIEAVKDGSKVWSYPESANGRISYYAAPAVDDKYVYAGTYSNRLHIINKEDGTLAADIEIGNNKNKVIASPLLTDDSVIVASSGGMVSSYPINAFGETVSPKWQTTLSGEVWVRPVYENGSVYVASMDKKINVLDALTGELKQSDAISGAIMNDPILADGKLYFSTLAHEVDELDLASGEVRVLVTTVGEIWGSPLLMGDKLIAADMSGYVYCIDIKTAEPVWTTDKITAEKVGFIASPVALDENTILLIDESGETMTYDLEGKSVGQRTQDQTVYTTPAVLDNGSFAVAPISADGQIKAYSASLKEDWIYVRSTEKSDGKTENKEGK